MQTATPSSSLLDNLLNAPQIIEDATVYTQHLYDDGRRYECRFYGKDKDLVEKFAKKRLASVDSYRSPSITPVQPYRDGFACILKVYGLD